ncbi:MAG: nicotinamide N-methylase [Candidatus Nephthysia bennettiae]|uniref:Methyltransferase n=1 Tax=Candidatus Nephthysia bennettiae TaxID=3127016 RepID=A0A934KA39_9BACT|nr:methyltransferase [Candidatus Dormibacteraeota bacterium]MBJ7611415.1 methyltransferase [Candidatus Dormibacteraeota bacterium]PZR91610.1 MAG: nicotinamide N-methylase [Candidatus Dormibacteraeota bacterium]
MNPETAAAFVRAHTRLLRPPQVPELRLHLAEDAFGLWKRTEEEVGHPGVPPPYWAFAWPGGQALARYLLDNPALVRGRSVFDLGSGSGLVAIAAAQAGAASVTASEVDVFALAAIGLNAGVNGVSIACALGDAVDGDGIEVDLVLAGDLFYERPMAERVMLFLERAQARGSDVLVGDPGREYLPRPRFVPLATYEVAVPPGLEDRDVKVTNVWRPASAR